MNYVIDGKKIMEEDMGVILHQIIHDIETGRYRGPNLDLLNNNCMRYLERLGGVSYGFLRYLDLYWHPIPGLSDKRYTHKFIIEELGLLD